AAYAAIKNSSNVGGVLFHSVGCRSIPYPASVCKMRSTHSRACGDVEGISLGTEKPESLFISLSTTLHSSAYSSSNCSFFMAFTFSFLGQGGRIQAGPTAGPQSNYKAPR